MVVLVSDARHEFADIDIVIARRVRKTGAAAYGNVPSTARQVIQRISTDRRVPIAVGVGGKRLSSEARVGVAGSVAEERTFTNGRVAIARVAVDRGIVEERLPTNGCVIEAFYVMKKCLRTYGCVLGAVAAGIASERLKTYRRVVVADVIAKKRAETGGRVPGAGGIVEECASTVGGVSC